MHDDSSTTYVNRKQRRADARGDARVISQTHAPDHYHAVADKHWRAFNNEAFVGHESAAAAGLRVFEVVSTPIEESAQPMPEEVAGQYLELTALAQSASDAAIIRLQEIAMKYPQVAIVQNLLAAAFARSGRLKEAESIVEQNYRRAPDYLFARVQYAQLCLATGRVRAVPAIFDHHFDLKLLYPHRSRYHISEFIAFTAVAAEYHWAIGQHRVARGYLSAMQCVAAQDEQTLRLAATIGSRNIG